MMATEFLKQKKEELGKELDVLKEEQKGYTRASMLEVTKAGTRKFVMFLEMAINVTVLIEQKEAEIAVIDELIDEAKELDELNAATVIIDPDGFRCEREIVNVCMEGDEYMTQVAIRHNDALPAWSTELIPLSDAVPVLTQMLNADEIVIKRI